MDIELEKLAAKWGGRLMHTEAQHEVISFRPDGFAGFVKEVQRIEREACAKSCEELWHIDGTETATQFADAIRGRSNAKVSGAGTASAGLPGYAAGGNGEKE